MTTLNLGILAHVDAGKTSLTERLLHTAGVIDEIGSVDDGNTQTDSMALERQRGITIKSAVVSFDLRGVTVNLIDTPGHPDFIAEVERVLSVLDGAVLVVSAVEGVQAQTRVLLRVLRRLRIPTLIFVNKIDRTGAREAGLLRDLATKLAAGVVPMGTVTGIGTKTADFVACQRIPGLLDALAEHDDTFLAAFVHGTPMSQRRLRHGLAAQTRNTMLHPVYFGSAITGAGVGALIDGITAYLPATTGDPAGPVSGTVFKVTRGPAGERVGYVRMFTGTLRLRDRLRCGRVTGISVFSGGGSQRRAELRAGEIGMVGGLDVRIGDSIGRPRAAQHYFSPPSLETVVSPCRPGDRGALHVAMTRLAEQDPLINLRLDELRGELSVSLYGEVQKEVIQATLAAEFGLDVTFRETTTICVERLAGTGASVERIGVAGNPFLATVGLRVEPGPPGSGVAFRLGVELGAMPYAFFKAVEDTVRATLRQGLCGWEVSDIVVTMTHSGYCPRQSHAHGKFDKSMSSTGADFRGVTPLVLMAALAQAGTDVHEPMHHFSMELPADTLGAALPVLTGIGAIPAEQVTRGTTTELEGDVPAAAVHALEQRLPGLTRGEGVLESAFDHYARVRGRAPQRARADHNPLNRKEYLLHVLRRV